MPELAPHIPSAEPRRSGGKPDTAPASEAGLTSPAPTPWTSREATSTPKLPASAPITAPAANTASPASPTRARADPVDQRPAREQRQAVGEEVGGQHPRELVRARAAARARPTAARR